MIDRWMNKNRSYYIERIDSHSSIVKQTKRGSLRGGEIARKSERKKKKDREIWKRETDRKREVERDTHRQRQRQRQRKSKRKRWRQ